MGTQMDDSYYFFSVILGTVIITKVVLLNPRIHCPTVLGVRLHHWMYGVALVVVGVTVSNITMYAIGLALFIDQLPLFIFRRWRHEDSYSTGTLITIGMFLALIFIFRSQLLSIIHCC